MLLWILILNVFCFAESDSSHLVSATKSPSNLLRSSYSEFNIHYVFWQEKFKATAQNVTSDFLSQYEGFQLGYARAIPLSNVRWLQYYGTNLSFGYAKGASDTDQAKKQQWWSINFSPGFLYRTSATSELGFLIPLAYKKTTWRFSETVNTNEQSFSVGATGMFTLRWNKKYSLNASLTHQFIWQAAIWSIGWQYDWR